MRPTGQDGRGFGESRSVLPSKLGVQGKKLNGMSREKTASELAYTLVDAANNDVKYDAAI